MQESAKKKYGFSRFLYFLADFLSPAQFHHSHLHPFSGLVPIHFPGSFPFALPSQQPLPVPLGEVSPSVETGPSPNIPGTFTRGNEDGPVAGSDVAGGRPWRCRWAKTFATCGARMHQLPFCVAGGAQKCPPAAVWWSTCSSLVAHLRRLALLGAILYL